MARWFPAAAIALFVLDATAAYAQAPRKDVRPTHDSFPTARLEGRVLDDTRSPIAGAMVSAIGRTTVAATTDRNGHYEFRELPYGPYILSVHSRGYYKSKSRTVQVTAETLSIPEIQLSKARKGLAEPVPAASVPAEPLTQLAGFGGLDLPSALAAAPQADSERVVPAASVDDEDEVADEDGETAWRLRHLPRSILKEADAVWVPVDEGESGWWSERGSSVVMPLAFFSDLPLSGQVNLMTVESFDTPGELFSLHAPRSVAYVSVNTQAAGGAWSMQGAMTQGDLSSWIVAGAYKSIDSGNHAYELGLSYSTQRYDGGNAAAMSAIRENARNVGRIYGYDEWTLSPRLILGYGTGYARYDYLGGPGVWSPRLSITLPIDRFRLKALASNRGLVPGAEEFAPSVTGMWLPPERTFSSLAPDGRFAVEQTRHLQVSLERDLAAGVLISIRGFDQQIEDQLIEIFDAVPGRNEAPVGHYYVASAGDLNMRGWGVAMVHDVPGYVRGTIEYTVATAVWDQTSDLSITRAVRLLPVSATEQVHDLTTTIEAIIPQTATRVYAKYRINSAFWANDPDAARRSDSNARFNVRVNQALPFLRFSNANWEALIDVRNMFREFDPSASLYDEALAIRAPKRIVGGLQVRF